MLGDDPRATTEREQTDDSLRSERGRVDSLVAAKLSIDELADAVISRARERADQVLAHSRAQSDEAGATPPGPPRAALARERMADDRAIDDERKSADELLRHERVEADRVLLHHRQQTDENLVAERSASDDELADRDDVLVTVAHDLRSMLHAMLGNAELVLEDEAHGRPAMQLRERVQHIQHAGNRMGRLIGDLVDVSRIRRGRLNVNLELSDPAHAVLEAVETFSAHALTNGISLSAEIVASCAVPHDPARILQVLSNLLCNAIKFSSPSSRVVVRVDRNEDEVRVVVSDSGVGIAADELERIFQRFVQLGGPDDRGLGLGLYISKCIVQAHGGRIWADSILGEGSRFGFTIPVRSQ